MIPDSGRVVDGEGRWVLRVQQHKTRREWHHRDFAQHTCKSRNSPGGEGRGKDCWTETAADTEGG